MPPACVNTRVIKKLSTTQRGALKLARRYGNALVCVRHRCDPAGLVRYTTVELLVNETVIQRRNGGLTMVAIRLQKKHSLEMQERIAANGGEWDRQAGVWRMPRSTAKRLGLLGCLIAK